MSNDVQAQPAPASMSRKLAVQLVQLLLAIGLGAALGFRTYQVGVVFAVLAALTWLSYLLRGRTAILRLLPWTVCMLLAAEFGARTYFAQRRSWSIWTPSWQAVERIYFRPQPMPAPDEHYDVLLLGGSVASEKCLYLPPQVDAAFAGMQDQPVRVHTLAQIAHGSRDSLFKWRQWKDQPWDAVVLYHGINETRMNAVPADVFRGDYGHFEHYAEVNALDRWSHTGFFLPAFLEKLVFMARQRLSGHDKIYSRVNNPEWFPYASDSKSAASFQENYDEIIAEARAHDTLVVTGSFATCMEKEDGTSIWGTDRHVYSGVQAHNAAARELARIHGALYVDWTAVMDDQPEYFTDECHLTPAGGDAWGAALTAALAGGKSNAQPPEIEPAPAP